MENNAEQRDALLNCREAFDKWLPGYAKRQYSFYTQEAANSAIRSSFGSTLWDAWKQAWQTRAQQKPASPDDPAPVLEKSREDVAARGGETDALAALKWLNSVPDALLDKAAYDTIYKYLGFPLGKETFIENLHLAVDPSVPLGMILFPDETTKRWFIAHVEKQSAQREVTGYVLVPVEPSLEQLGIGANALDPKMEKADAIPKVYTIWKAMLAAAPKSDGGA